MGRSKRHTHMTNLRLYVNAGIAIPECRANAHSLDLNAGKWRLANDAAHVDCKHCLKIIAAIGSRTTTA